MSSDYQARLKLIREVSSQVRENGIVVRSRVPARESQSAVSGRGSSATQGMRGSAGSASRDRG